MPSLTIPTPHILAELREAVRDDIDAGSPSPSDPGKRTQPVPISCDAHSNCRPQDYTPRSGMTIFITRCTCSSPASRMVIIPTMPNRPLDQLGRCLVRDSLIRGNLLPTANGETRGERTTGLPPRRFVSFLQNHDQIGNRAFGERIVTIADPRAVRAAMAILLLAPSPPMLFMGEEFGAQNAISVLLRF